MIRVSVRQMEYFGALAETLHFGRAAALMGVTQPALSAQIAEMEERLQKDRDDPNGMYARFKAMSPQEIDDMQADASGVPRRVLPENGDRWIHSPLYKTERVNDAARRDDERRRGTGPSQDH